jgi:hypothetical protein
MHRVAPRKRLVLVVALAALLLVPAAVAVGGKIIDFFEGTPPPPSVSMAYQQMNRVADYATRQSFGAEFPKADVTKLHGVIEINTPDGPQDLWAAPNNQGGQCWTVDFANDTPNNGVQPTSGTCDDATPPPSKINFSDFWLRWHSDLLTGYGRVYVDATSVTLTLADGSTVTAPVVEGFYLASFSRDAKVIQVTAFDSAGSEVATFSTAPTTQTQGPHRQVTGTDTVTQP